MHYASATLVKLETKAMLPNVGYLLVHVLRVKFQTILVTEIAYGKSLKLGWGIWVIQMNFSDGIPVAKLF